MRTINHRLLTVIFLFCCFTTALEAGYTLYRLDNDFSLKKINDNGQVVGLKTNADGTETGVIYDYRNEKYLPFATFKQENSGIPIKGFNDYGAVLFENNEKYYLRTPSNKILELDLTYAYGLNNRYQVIRLGLDRDSYKVFHYLWNALTGVSSTQIKKLFTNTFASSLNDKGHILFYISGEKSGFFLCDNGNIFQFQDADQDILIYDSLLVFDMNNLGDLVLEEYNQDDELSFKSYFWPIDGEKIAVEGLSGFKGISFRGLNDYRQFVGVELNSSENSRAIFWDEAGGMKYFDDLVNNLNPKEKIIEGVRITNKGYISVLIESEEGLVDGILVPDNLN